MTSTFVASGSLTNNSKTAPMPIPNPTATHSAPAALDQLMTNISPSDTTMSSVSSSAIMPTLMSTSPTSSFAPSSVASSTASGGEEDTEESMNEKLDLHETRRRHSKQFFFPHHRGESIVPEIVKAVKPVEEDPTEEIDRLYHGDSRMTVDGRHLVRLL